MPTQLQKSQTSVLTEAPNGSWWYTPMPGLQDEPRTTKVACVLVKCPTCGAPFRLRDADVMGQREDGTQGHHIAWDGMVSPSVVCPKECGFHDVVRLKDWDEPIESSGVDAAVQPPPPPAADDKTVVVKLPMAAPTLAKLAAGDPPKAAPRATAWWCSTCHFEVVSPQAPKVKPGAFDGSNCPNCPKGVMVHMPNTVPPAKVSADA